MYDVTLNEPNRISGDLDMPLHKTTQDFTDFTSLPPELKSWIARHLVAGDIYEMARDLNSFMLTSSNQLGAVMGDPRLRRFNARLQQAGQMAADLSKKLAAVSQDGGSSGSGDQRAMVANYADMSVGALAAHGPLLGILPPRRRLDLINAALDLEDPSEQAIAIVGMVAGFETIQADERSAFVLDILNLNEEGRSVVLGGDLHRDRIGLNEGIGWKLEYLPPVQRSALVKNVHRMEDLAEKLWSIGGLAPGFGQLKPSEVVDLVEMVCDPLHPQAVGDLACAAIARFGPGLKYLPSRQLDQIISVIADPSHLHAPSDIQGKAWAIGGLGAGLECFTSAQRTHLFDITLTMDSAAIATVIAGWGEGWQHLKRSEQAELFEMITNSNHPKALTGNPRARAIAGMGSALKDLEPQDRSKLVKIICSHDPSNDPLDTAVAIAGMGRGLEYLKPAERSALLGTTLALKGHALAVAISGMGQGFGYLTPAERSALVTAASQFPRQAEEWVLGAEQTDFIIAMSGLTKGVQNWTRDLFKDKDIVIEMSPPNRSSADRSRPDAIGL